MRTMIKLFIKPAIILSLAMSVGLNTSCKDDDDNIYSGLQLDKMSYTFDNDGKEQLVIKVTTTPPQTWKYNTEEDWIEIVSKDTSSLTIRAKENTLTGIRTGQITFAAGAAIKTFTLTQLGTGEDFARYRNIPTPESGGNMSRNGRYAAAMFSDVNPVTDEYEFTPVLIDLYTGEWNYKPKLEAGSSYSLLHVTNQGLLVISDESRLGLLEGDEVNWDYFELPSNYGMTEVYASSDDGTIFVGQAAIAFDDDYGIIYGGLLWTNGSLELLPLPESSSVNQPVMSVMAYGCSADGTIIYGNEMFVNDPIIWKNGTPEIIGAEYTERWFENDVYTIHPMFGLMPQDQYEMWSKLVGAGPNRISPNGKYLGMHMEVDYLGTYNGTDRVVRKRLIPAICELSTGEITILDKIEWGYTSAVTNNGTLAYTLYTDDDYPFRSVVTDINTSFVQDADTWIKANFGINVSKNLVINQISEDMNAAFGTIMKEGGLGYYYPYWYVSGIRE